MQNSLCGPDERFIGRTSALLIVMVSLDAFGSETCRRMSYSGVMVVCLSMYGSISYHVRVKRAGYTQLGAFFMTAFIQA